jgi:hypothetical protein
MILTGKYGTVEEVMDKAMLTADYGQEDESNEFHVFVAGKLTQQMARLEPVTTLTIPKPASSGATRC